MDADQRAPDLQSSNASKQLVGAGDNIVSLKDGPFDWWGGKEKKFHIYPQISLLWSNIRQYSFREKKSPNRPNFFLTHPIIMQKIKVRLPQPCGVSIQRY